MIDGAARRSAITARVPLNDLCIRLGAFTIQRKRIPPPLIIASIFAHEIAVGTIPNSHPIAFFCFSDRGLSVATYRLRVEVRVSVYPLTPIRLRRLRVTLSMASRSACASFRITIPRLPLGFVATQ